MSVIQFTLAAPAQRSAKKQPNTNAAVSLPISNREDSFQKQSVQKAPQFGGLCGSKEAVDINTRDEKGQTAVYRATLYGNIRKVEKLVDQGADVSIPDKGGKFPLMDAAETNQIAIAGLLLRGTNARVNQRDASNSTALIQAAFHGKDNMVAFLLSQGADCTLKNDQDHTALREAQHMKGVIERSNDYKPNEKAAYAKRYDRIIGLLEEKQQQNQANIQRRTVEWIAEQKQQNPSEVAANDLPQPTSTAYRRVKFSLPTK